MALGAAALAGCAHYEFDIARPGDGSQVVSGDSETSFHLDPLIYRARARENRLVLLIQNTLDQPVELLGAKSSAVDPKGQSHPLRSQTIAPNAYIKLILPPLRPRFETAPAGFSVGVGMQSRLDDSALPARAASPDKVLYLDCYADVDSTYWDWDGESAVRLLFTYQQRDGKIFSHELNLRKRKA